MKWLGCQSNIKCADEYYKNIKKQPKTPTVKPTLKRTEREPEQKSNTKSYT